MYLQQPITLCKVCITYREVAARLTWKGFHRMVARLSVKGLLKMTGVTVHTLFHQQKRGEQAVLIPISHINACAAKHMPC